MQFKFNNLTDLLITFNTEEKCKAFLEQQRWKGKVVCPHCGADKVYRIATGFRCTPKGCNKKFTVTVGTVFEKTYMPLQKWFMAIYLFTAHKKGISSCQLARDLGIAQKSGWFILKRIYKIFDIEPVCGKYNTKICLFTNFEDAMQIFLANRSPEKYILHIINDRVVKKKWKWKKNNLKPT